MWARAIICLLAALAVSGCALLSSQAPLLPDQHDVALDQLVVHSNFEIPHQHRLLREINAQRADLSNLLALPISDEPIHVFLFQDADRFHDFVRRRFPDFPARRAFFVESDTSLAVYAHWGDRVAEDLRHEVAHGYLHAVVQNLPLWLDEGLAEYFEVPRGHHGLNRPHIEELALLAREQTWSPDIRRLESIPSPAEMSQRDYAEAWAWIHWLLESDSAHREVLQTYLARLRRDGVTPPLSFYLRELGANPERELLEHIRYVSSRP